jgi:hypothetical protein
MDPHDEFLKSYLASFSTEEGTPGLVLQIRTTLEVREHVKDTEVTEDRKEPP